MNDEQACRQAYDDFYHKVRAEVGYDHWAAIWRFIRKRRGEPVDLDRYDAGFLGGQDGMPAYVWHDIIRAELDRAYDFYMDQLDRAAPQPADLLAWQPISTAPHETELLLGWEQWDGNWVTEVSMATWSWRAGNASKMSQHGYATHWVPLPAPATKAQREEERE